MRTAPAVSELSVRLTEGTVDECRVRLDSQQVSVKSVLLEPGRLLLPDGAGSARKRETGGSSAPGGSTPSLPWTVRVGSVVLTGNRAEYGLLNHRPAAGFDPSFIVLSTLDLAVDSIYNRGADIALQIRRMAFTERSGLTVSDMTGDIGMDASGISLAGVTLKTPFSRIEANISAGEGILALAPDSPLKAALTADVNTKDLKYGLLTKEVISSKPLMVLPNLPRFVRQGDEVSISTQVINNSKEAVSGRVRIELFDPATDQPIICLSKSQRPFELQPDSIATVSWIIPVPKQISLLGVRILADSEKGSDGEQQIVPVLSNQLLITESTPFYLLKEGEKQIRISGNSEGATPFRLTLEMTGNPIWYAVQALPTITQPNNDNILSWFAAYYSNTLASYIAQAHPRIQKVINQWTAQGGNASTLYSNLEKNQELKNILLEETPWVLAADNETEQKQRLSLLFDLNRADGLREAALQQLIQQQNEEGGWSWFKGFPASRAITLAILKGMSQLVQLNAIQYGQAEKEMQMKALKFLDKSMQTDYENLLKYDKKWQNAWPSPEQVEFLFVRSSYRDIPELGDAREAIRFYTNQAEKHWNQYSLISKGEIALLMHRNGKKEVSTAILTWLKKTATISEEKGMYWANNRRGVIILPHRSTRIAY